MASQYATVVATNRLNVVNDAVNSKTYVAGSGAGSAGSLVIGTSALSGATGVLVTIALPNPAFSISGRVATLLGVTLTGTSGAAGTAALAELRNNAGTVVYSGLTVGTSASDVIVNTTTVSNAQPVNVTSGTITHP